MPRLIKYFKRKDSLSGGIRMLEYSLGLAVDAEEKDLLVIKKTKPEWQRGKFNGIGGKLEFGETAKQCMVREFEEECGIKSQESDWEPLIKFVGSDYIVHVFVSTKIDIYEYQTTTEEMVTIFPLAEVLFLDYGIPFVPNMRWLVNMILDTDFRKYNLELHYKEV
jgi:8-oxo-dGTP diphosphatase